MNVNRPNSVFNSHLIAYYKGQDDLRTLRLVLGQYREQINCLSKLELDFLDKSGTVIKKKIKIIVTGDTMFLAHLLGFQGPSAKYPCSFCEIELKFLRNKTYGTFFNFPLRDLSTLAKEKSQIEPPLFDIATENVCPPMLHIMIGLVSDIFKAIQNLATEIDCKSMNISQLPLEKTKQDFKRIKESKILSLVIFKSTYCFYLQFTSRNV